MNPACAGGLRCPVCGGALALFGRTLRCARGHCFDLAREGYVNLLPIRKKHAADPGDGKEMVAARRAFLQAGHYDRFRQALAELCTELAPPGAHIVDAGCGEGSYDQTVLAALTAAGRDPQLIGFDLAKPAVRLAARLVPGAMFAVGGSFCAPVRDGWADLLLNIFSPFAAAEFARMLRPGGVLIYAVPTPRHLFVLKQVLYDAPYENPVQSTAYPGFAPLPDRERTVTGTLTLDAAAAGQLFAMTPYAFKTPAEGVRRLAGLPSLTTEIGFRFLVYRRQFSSVSVSVSSPFSSSSPKAGSSALGQAGQYGTDPSVSISSGMFGSRSGTMSLPSGMSVQKSSRSLSAPRGP